MIFQLNKNKPDLPRSVESDTIARWREMSASKGDEASESAPTTIDVAIPLTKASEPDLAPKWATESEPMRPSSGTASPSPLTRASEPPARPAPLAKVDAVHSALGPGTVIEGKLRFDSPVRIDGSLIGEVTSTSVLIVGEQAVVKAIVNVGSLVVHGQVTGQVEAHEKVEIKEGGSLEANIKTKHLVIDQGGYFRGGCNTN